MSRLSVRMILKKEVVLNSVTEFLGERPAIPSNMTKPHLRKIIIQFTICSSATSEGFLPNLHFFHILRQSGNPWITLDMNPTTAVHWGIQIIGKTTSIETLNKLNS